MKLVSVRVSGLEGIRLEGDFYKKLYEEQSSLALKYYKLYEEEKEKNKELLNKLFTITGIKERQEVNTENWKPIGGKERFESRARRLSAESLKKAQDMKNAI